MITMEKVYFGAGFFETKGHGRAGRKIRIDKRFQWGGFDCYLPAIYCCGRGLVLDLCVEASPEQIQTFIKKWNLTDEEGTNLSEIDRELIVDEHPLNIHARAMLTINKRRLQMKHGCSQMWIPQGCLPEGVQEDDRSRRIVEDYGLDPEKGYGVYRFSFPWATKRKPILKAIELKLAASPVLLPGIVIEGLKSDDTVRFRHPLTGTEHILSVRSVENRQLPNRAFRDPQYEFPINYIELLYALDPDIPDSRFALKDIRHSDQPRRRKNAGGLYGESDGENAGGSIGIIGGADGPTAIFMAGPGKQPGEHLGGWHVACSSFSFEPVEAVKWRAEFREKLREDICIHLRL